MLPKEVAEVAEMLGLLNCDTGQRKSPKNVPRPLKNMVKRLAREGWFDVVYAGDELYAKQSALLLHYLAISGKC